MPLIDQKWFELAVQNISSLGDTDVFPLPFENHVLHDMSGDVVDLLMEMSSSFTEALESDPPVNHSALAPLGYNGFRWTTQIDPLWNAYFLGVVLSLAESIEEKRPPNDAAVVFSHRFAPDGDHLFDREGWAKFQARSLELAETSKLVVSADIADFYGRVYHHRIDNELGWLDDSERTKQIVKLLGKFSNGVSYGLPVGGPASRILSELVLNSVDRLLLSLGNFKFVRYADDYRFFVNDLESAHRCIGFLSEKLQRNEGLSLQRSKTRIMTAAEFLASAKPRDPSPGSAAKFLSLHLYYDPYSATAEEDYEDLQRQLDEFDVLGLLRDELFKGRIDQALTKKLVNALRHMQSTPKGQALQSLMENLETLAPVLPQVLRAIRVNINSVAEDVQLEVHAGIRKLIIDGHHLSQVDINLAYMIRVLAQRSLDENRDLLIQVYQQPHGYGAGPAPNIQRDILLTLAKWDTNFWLHDIKPHYATMHRWTGRSFIVGSFALGDEGRHWRQGAKASFGPFEQVVAKWAAERFNLAGWEIPT